MTESATITPVKVVAKKRKAENDATATDAKLQAYRAKRQRIKKGRRERKLAEKETEAAQAKFLETERTHPFSDPVYKITGVPYRHSLASLKPIFDEENIVVEFMKVAPDILVIVSETDSVKLESLSGRTVAGKTIRFTPSGNIPSLQLQVSNFKQSRVTEDALKQASGCARVQIVPISGKTYVQLATPAAVKRLGKQISIKGTVAKVTEVKYGPKERKALKKGKSKVKHTVCLTMPKMDHISHQLIGQVTGGRVVKSVPPCSSAILTFDNRKSGRKLAREVTMDVGGVKLEVAWTLGKVKENVTMETQPKGLEARKLREKEKREEEKEELLTLEKLEKTDPFFDRVYDLPDVPLSFPLTSLHKFFVRNKLKVEFMKCPKYIYCIVKPDQSRHFESLSGQTVDGMKLKFRPSKFEPSLNVSVSGVDPNRVSTDDLRKNTGCLEAKLHHLTGRVFVEITELEKANKLPRRIMFGGTWAKVTIAKDGSVANQCKRNGTVAVLLFPIDTSKTTTAQIESATGGRVVKTAENKTRAFLKFPDRDSARKIVRKITLKINDVTMEVSWSVGVLKRIETRKAKELMVRPDTKFLVSDLSAPYCAMRGKLLAFLAANNVSVVSIAGRFDDTYCRVVTEGNDRVRILALNGHDFAGGIFKVDWMFSPKATVLLSDVDTDLLKPEDLLEATNARHAITLTPTGPHAVVLMESIKNAAMLAKRRTVTINGCKMRVYQVDSPVKSRAKVILMDLDIRLVTAEDLLKIPYSARASIFNATLGKAFVRFDKCDQASKFVKSKFLTLNGQKMLISSATEEAIVNTAAIYYYIGNLPAPLSKIEGSLCVFFHRKFQTKLRDIKGDVGDDRCCYVTVTLADRDKMESAHKEMFNQNILEVEEVERIPDYITPKSGKAQLKEYSLGSDDEDVDME